MICRNCLASTLTMPCPACAQRHVTGQNMAFAVRSQMHPRYASVRQFAGQVTSDGSTGASDTQTAAQGNAGQVQTTSWQDLELIYPGFWIPWAAGKLADAAVEQYFSNEADAKQRRDDLALVAKQLDDVIGSCSKVPQNNRTNWTTFTTQFIQWFNVDTSASDFDNTADQKTAASYQTQLRNWQIEIKKYCNIGMPLLPEPNPSLSQLGNKALDTANNYFSTVKTVTIVTALGVAALLIFSPRARAMAAAAL